MFGLLTLAVGEKFLASHGWSPGNIEPDRTSIVDWAPPRSLRPGEHHEQNLELDSSRLRGSRLDCAFPADFWTGGRQQAWQGAFRNLMQAGSAEAVRQSNAVPALVLVPRVTKRL